MKKIIPKQSQDLKPCKSCGTTRRKHIAKGLCVKCYPIFNKLEAVKKWDPKNPKTLKTYFSTYYLSDPRTFVKFKTCIAKQLKHRLDWLRAREEKMKGPIDGLDLEYKFGWLASKVGCKKDNLFHGLADWFEGNFNKKQRLVLFAVIDKIQQDIPWRINWNEIVMDDDW